MIICVYKFVNTQMLVYIMLHTYIPKRNALKRMKAYLEWCV